MECRVLSQKVPSRGDRDSPRPSIHGPQDPGGHLWMMLIQAMAKYDQEIRGMDLLKASGVGTFNESGRDVI